MPDQLPWRYRDDSYYRKGSFSVEFRIEPLRAEAEFGSDEEPQQRALQQFLLALRDETGLKISSFIDVWSDEEDEDADYSSAEFVIYNKLGVTSLGKLRRFMEDHLKGDVNPRVILIDPETDQHFRCTWFTIRYLFHEFVAHHQPDDWERLRELMNQEDRGYRELMRSRPLHEGRVDNILYRGHLYRVLDR